MVVIQVLVVKKMADIFILIILISKARTRPGSGPHLPVNSVLTN